MAEQAAAHDARAAHQAAARRSTKGEIAQALDLGWRVAALHALRPTKLEPPAPVSGDMLLNRRSLSPSDRVELEVRAIAGVAERAGVGLGDTELAGLLGLADGAGRSAVREQTFRDEIARRHIAFQKGLWAVDESHGKAYELGNFLSDTWNRVLRPLTTDNPDSELREVFSEVRVERIKLLLDDLQTRIDPVAVHAVSNHLDVWQARVAAVPAPPPAAEPPTPERNAVAFSPVERQTVIWRQILTGDKEPEAWISHGKRVEVRDELTRQLWKRYRRPLPWLLPILIALGVLIALLYSSHKDTAQDLLATMLAAAGAFGLTRATMIATVRRGLKSWGDLMWNRALAAVICRETCIVDELFPPVVTRRDKVRRKLRW